MLKQHEIDITDSTLNRTPPDEPIFILCARDSLAVDAVRHWIYLARMSGVNEAKLADAKACLAKMRSWRKKHGTKVPD